MTRNQIEFHKMMETRRANRVTEDITRTRDERSHQVALGQLAELGRHNKEQERQGQIALDETSRHNLASESHARDVLAEQQRHSMVQEAETNRSNIAREIETNRANLAHEAETRRSNLSREQETRRANLAAEALRSAELAEMAKYHASSINLGYANLAETSRANKANEAERLRTNLAHEIETNRSNIRSEELRQQANDETRSHNTAIERAEARKIGLEQQRLQQSQQRIDSENLRRGFQNARDVTGMLQSISSEARQWINMF